MRIEEFPNCCGINIVADFGNTKVIADCDYDESDDPGIDEIMEYLQKKEVLYKNTGILMATINQEQKKAIGKAFTLAKWKLISKCNHPGHGNNIYVYAKVLNPIKL